MPSALVELDWLETLHKPRREGKIDRIGVSLRDNEPDEMRTIPRKQCGAFCSGLGQSVW
jgi:hypothetical protein